MKSFVKVLLVMFLVGGFACNSNKSSQDKTEETSTMTATTDAALVTLKVEGMTCTGCENTITTKLTTVSGVKSVKASHETGKVLVLVDKTELNSDKAPQLDLAKAVEESGYTVASIEVEKTN